LLHVRPTILGFERSQVRDPRFLFANNGDRDREAELVATIQALLNPDGALGEEHAICRFPGRKRWIENKLNLDPQIFPKPSCRLYELYKKRMATKTISLVFSSYFAESPSSAFGHTLFRVSRELKGNQQKNELLDWGIGYAGEVDTPNPLMYVLKGLSGGFRGTFSSVPYYMKVREYNDFESRDLWSYELNLTQEEIDFLLDHLWEIGDHHFDYYFITQNCGFHLLTALEASAPRLQLVEQIPFWVIPADALKVVAREPGLVRNISLRPSLLAQLENKYEHLTFDKKKQFLDVKNESRPWREVQDSEVFDTYISYFDYSSARKLAQEDEGVIKDRNELLLHRSKLPTVNGKEKTADEKVDFLRPDLSHPSGRFSLSGERDQKNRNNLNVDLRFALHDSLDPQNGYPLYSTVEMFRFNWQASEDKLNLTQFDFLAIESISPLTDLKSHKSWGTKLGYRLIDDQYCQLCSSHFFQVSVGMAQELKAPELVTYLFLRGGLLRPYSVAGFEGGLVWNKSPWSFQVKLGPEWIFESEVNYQNTLALEVRWYSNKNYFIRANLNKKADDESYQVGLGSFF
jgi:hypothetical protein